MALSGHANRRALSRTSHPDAVTLMGPDTKLDLVTGAFSYSGSHIAERLLASGRQIRTLTFHPDRPHPLREQVQAFRYHFDDPRALTPALEGVTTLYNTYWVRFNHGATTFTSAVANSQTLFEAARRAGVSRIVHVSIANPSLDSPLPYYRGKALVERALDKVGLPHSIVRPTWIFGGEHEILANNIAWILRHMPIFAIPGDGRYAVQPVHINDLVQICLDAANAHGNVILDAAGPETMTFEQLVQAIRRATRAGARIVHVPPIAMAGAARVLGLLVRDVVLTADEIAGLTAGLLVSHQPPRGRIAFSKWLTEHAPLPGGSYANELRRHYS
jgi:NADH dehydrogenase